MPADASVYALQVVDRFYLFRSYSHAAAGLYAVAIKLATVVFVAVRGFQYAWPPLAYSIEDDEEAARLYSLVTTYYALATGVVVCAVALLGRWMVRLLAAPAYFDAHRALPWLALGWALYGLYLVFVAIAGRARVTSRNLPAAAAGLAVNVALLLAARARERRRARDRGCRPRAVRRLRWRCSSSSTRSRASLFRGRLRMAAPGTARRRSSAAVAVSGELLLPDHGAAGLLARVAWLALVPGGAAR